MSSIFLNFFRKIKLIDIVVFAVFAAVTVYAFSFAYSGGVERRELVVHTPRGVFAYDMSKDRIIDVEGAIGISRIEISGDTARFLGHFKKLGWILEVFIFAFYFPSGSRIN